MKKLLLAVLVLLSSACTSEVIEMGQAEVPATRSMIDDISTTNPNLVTDWEHQEDIVLSNGNAIPAPWAQPSSIVSNVEFAMDVKKEDGWIMLCHTFKALNSYENINYIMLYNELTGFLKVFYYNQTNFSAPNGALWHFKSENGLGTSLFNLNDYFALPKNAANKNSFVTLSNALDEPSNGFQPGWNGFEMEIPYTTDYANMLFSMSTYNKSITSYTFSGTSESKIEGTIVKTMSGSSGIFKAISAIGGQGAKALIGKLKTKVDNGQATDTTGTVKAKLGSKIINALSKIPGGGYKSAILGGLKAIFGSNMVTETQQVHLTSNGTINMSGTSINTSTGAPFPIGHLNWYNIAGMNNPLPNGRYLGVWTLTNAPTFSGSRYSTIRNSDGHSASTGILYSPMLSGLGVNVEINPNLEPYITSRSVTSELIYCERFDNKDNHRYSFQVFGNDLIYSDRSMTLVEVPREGSIPASRLCSGLRIAEGYEPFYDWGTEPEEHFVIVVTVELTYNYKGKSHTIVSSRPYRAKYTIDESNNGNHFRPNGKIYIVNTGEYPLEGRRDPIY